MIHIKRSRALGDVVWVEPIIRYFITQGEKVNLVTLYPEIFANYPSKELLINGPIVSATARKDASTHRFIDLDMAYEMSPKMHILEAYQRQALIPKMHYTYPQLHLTQEEKKSFFTQDYIILHIEKHPLNFRNVYGIDWEKVIDYIKGLGLAVLQISHSGKDIYGQWIQTDNIRKIMSLIYHSKLFIGLDSGPSHIAASLSIPSILFFGSVNPLFRHLKDFKGLFLQGHCPHAHCYHEVVSTKGQPCRLVGEKEAPPCCTQTTDKVIEAIDRLYGDLSQ